VSRWLWLAAACLLPPQMSKKAAAAKSGAPKEAGASNGATVKDVPAGEFIAALAAHFKKSAKIEVPEWADIVKVS